MSAAQGPHRVPDNLAANPSLDRWVGFPVPGRVAIATGKVEIGQGVLTAMVQIAAEELDVAPERIALRSGDTGLTPNEGYTAGSMSIQYGGVALRAACAEVRGLFLAELARRLGCAAADLSVEDGAFLRGGVPTGADYWSLADLVPLARPPTAGVAPKPPAAHRVVGRSLPRIDLPAKVFGEAAFIHDMTLDGMVHARVIRQPKPGARIAKLDEARIRRSAPAAFAEGSLNLVRRGDFLAVLGQDETVVEAAAGAADHAVAWADADPVSPIQAEARWLLQRPSLDSVAGPPEPAPGGRSSARHEATFTRPYVAHASMAPSCGLALYRDGHLTVWSHTQGVHFLREALARSLHLDPAAITVKHVQGPGCYGHNGADDAAADAAVLALEKPGVPVRVRWRREEEFAFEPVSPAMVVTVRATVDAEGRPADWTQEVWSGPHTSRPGRSGNLLAAEALPDPPPQPARGIGPEHTGGGMRNGDPLYAIPAARIIHHLIPETPVRTSALRGLGATANVLAIETVIDELAEKAGADPVAYRLSLLADERAAKVVSRAAAMAKWVPGLPAGSGRGRGIGFARYKNSAAYAAVVVELEAEEEIRLLRVWSAVDSGLVVNPDGAINQLEGGIVQGASWALKERVRLDGPGIASRDFDAYPVLRFSEVPEIEVALVDADADRPPLGAGEATGGPTVAAVANAAAHALGHRFRDLPLDRATLAAAILSA